MVVGVVAGYVLARRILARRARSVAALTDRQREVLRAVAGGLSTKEIALLLGITATELQSRPGIPVLLKKRDLLQFNEVEIYLNQLAARSDSSKGDLHGKSVYFTHRTRYRLGTLLC